MKSNQPSSKIALPVLWCHRGAQSLAAAGTELTLVDSCRCLASDAEVICMPASAVLGEVDGMLNSVVCIQSGVGLLVVQHPLVFFSRNVRSFNALHQLHIFYLGHEITHPDVSFDTCIHKSWSWSTRFLEVFDFSFASRSPPGSW